ncbi:MAG TPA: prepilin-type N-terminal cleavage/methylation domain-containing protein, partial [Candidatus Saccharibacteria bacterium]|nr:prepilin-type N-terminal cleavage/methylation domain-containing protein [Candidatus Saccharibacteria bacterium]
MRLSPNTNGFTIVELLIVIVIIGVLAAITIVAYTGISQQAGAAGLKSDLKQASTQLELAKAQSVDGNYPSNDSAIKKSNKTTFQYTLTGTNYCLSATNDTQAFHLDSSVGDIQDGVCTGHTPPSGGGGSGSGWKGVSTGNYHACAIDSNDKAYCWGDNYLGQLGINNTIDDVISIPSPVYTLGVLSGKTLKSIDSGYGYACAIASDDQAYCWGNNYRGQLGNNSTSNTSVPVAVDTSGVLSGKTMKSISVGMYQACVIASDNQAYCWGYNNNGQLGNNSTSNTSVPVAVD